MFIGDVLNAGNYKPSASTVGGYRALNVIANQLRNELLKLPENVFAQAATKGQLLSTLGVFTLMVGSGHYSTAATTLDNGFVKRTDGYAMSGSPDTNDVSTDRSGAEPVV